MWSTPPRLSRVERRSAGAASLPKLLVRGRLQICRQTANKKEAWIDHARGMYSLPKSPSEQPRSRRVLSLGQKKRCMRTGGRAGGRWIRPGLCLAWLSTEALPAAVTREPARVCWIACATPHHAMQSRAMPDSHAARCGATTVPVRFDARRPRRSTRESARVSACGSIGEGRGADSSPEDCSFDVATGKLVRLR